MMTVSPQAFHAPIPSENGKTVNVEDFLPLVRKVAERMARRLPSVVDLGDLMAAGTVGLIDAASKYDFDRCDRFAGYAEFRIRGAILDELRTMDWVPRSVRSKGHALRDAYRTLQHLNGESPDTAAVADYLGVTEQQVFDMEREVNHVNVVAVEDVSVDGFARFSGDDESTPDQEFGQSQMRERLAAAVTELPERERQVLSLYYLEDLRLKEIGEIFGVTESRICQIHARAVKRLRGILEAEETF